MRFIYFQLRIFVRFILRLFYSLEIDGLHYIEQQQGPVILAGNHTGWLDALVVCAASPRQVRFLVVDWVLNLPVLGAIIRAFGGISVRKHKGSYAIEEAANCLAVGEDICIFPEGKLSLDGKITDFRSGVARLQKASKCPVVPFAIYGSYEAWPYNRRLPRLCKIAIHFGVPLNRLELETIETCRELQDIVSYMKGSLDRRHSEIGEPESSLIGLIQSKSDTFSARPALCLKEHGGKWNEISYAELSRRATRLSSYLMENDVNPGDNIAILSEWRPEFAVCLFAAWRAGLTVVSLNAATDNADLENILRECQPKIIFASAKMSARLDGIKSSLETLQDSFLLNEQLTGTSKLTTIDKLVPQSTHPSIHRQPEDIAVITYSTSNSHGPKGVMTIFENLIFQARLFETIADVKQGERFIVIPPVNHLLWLAHGLLAILHAGGTAYFSRNYAAADIVALTKERQLTGVIAGSNFYSSLQSFIETTILNTSLNKLFRKHAARKTLGKLLKILLNGDNSIDPLVNQFFEQIGLPILSGYGIPESSSVIACNTPNSNRAGSAGRIAEGAEIKIDQPTGEICTRGPHIMKGYYKNDQLTSAAIDEEGWLHTGDIGKIDSDGFLYVLGKVNSEEANPTCNKDTV